MKFHTFISVFLAVLVCVSAFSLPERKRQVGKRNFFYKRQTNNTGSQTSSTTSSGGQETGTPGGTTGGGGSGSSGNATGGEVPVLITGGAPQTGNISSSQTVSNTTGTMNITQLYSLSNQINVSLSTSQSVVIVGTTSSLNSVAFFNSIIFDTNKTIVSCEDHRLGQIVAQDKNAQGRGPLIVNGDNAIFSGTLPPWSVPVGIVGDDNKAHWFTDPCPPLLIKSNSALRSQFSNFSNTNPNSRPIVPIVFEDGVSSSLLQTVGSSISGLIVVSSGVNSTTAWSNTTQFSIPVVYVQSQSQSTQSFGFLSNTTIPPGAISGGYLSPDQAQTLLSIAIANNVTSTASLKQIFPQ